VDASSLGDQHVRHRDAPAAVAMTAIGTASCGPIWTVRRARAGRRRLGPGNLDHCLRECLWSFLGQIVPNAALDDPMCIFARELLGVGTGVRVWRPVSVTFKGDGRYPNDGEFRKALVQIVVLGFALGQSDSPTIIVDHDADMIWIIEGHCGAIERGIIEIPFRRSELPDKFCKIAPVFVVAGPAVLSGKIILVPPLAAMDSCSGCRSGSHLRRRALCTARAIKRR